MINKVDLCIVSYNALEKTERLLHSIYELNDNSLFDVYVADNGSSDGSAEALVHLAKDYGFTYFQNPNVGYSAACNQLAYAGTNNIIGLLNCDVWFDANNIRQIIDSFLLHPDAGVIGPKQRDENGNITHAGIVGSNIAPRHRGWQQPDKLDTEYKDFIECVTVSGSAYFVRRSIWEEASSNREYMRLYDKFADHSSSRLRVSPKYWLDNPGAFLSTPHYYEETFASYFIRHLGYKICYDGTISMGHSWHGSHEKNSKMDKMFTVSQAMFREACDHFEITHD